MDDLIAYNLCDMFCIYANHISVVKMLDLELIVFHCCSVFKLYPVLLTRELF